MSTLVFDHIPKTAGTTFKKAYLKTALKPSERWILSGGPHNERDRQQFVALPDDQRQSIRVVAGHYAESLRAHLPDARFITVIREPLSRTISAYLHARYHPDPGHLWRDVRDEQLSLREFAARYWSEVNDFQSQTVLGADCAALDDQAIGTRMDERYALVGCTEAFDSFVFLLHRQEGLPLGLYTNRLVRAERESYRPSAEDVEAVRACTAIDARLHRIVQARCEAALAALSDEAQAAHRQFLASLQQFRMAAETASS